RGRVPRPEQSAARALRQAAPVDGDDLAAAPAGDARGAARAREREGCAVPEPAQGLSRRTHRAGTEAGSPTSARERITTLAADKRGCGSGWGATASLYVKDCRGSPTA